VLRDLGIEGSLEFSIAALSEASLYIPVLENFWAQMASQGLCQCISVRKCRIISLSMDAVDSDSVVSPSALQMYPNPRLSITCDRNNCSWRSSVVLISSPLPFL
jgi:hypothetical protein